MIFRYNWTIRDANKGSRWELYSPDETEEDGNLLIRLGEDGERLSFTPRNVISQPNKVVTRLLQYGIIEVEQLSVLLNENRNRYPEYIISLTLQDSVVWIGVDGEHLFGFDFDGRSYAIVDAHGDEGWEYYGKPEELRYRVNELFSEVGKSIIFSSFILG